MKYTNHYNLVSLEYSVVCGGGRFAGAGLRCFAGADLRRFAGAGLRRFAGAGLRRFAGAGLRACSRG